MAVLFGLIRTFCSRSIVFIQNLFRRLCFTDSPPWSKCILLNFCSLKTVKESFVLDPVNLFLLVFWDLLLKKSLQWLNVCALRLQQWITWWLSLNNSEYNLDLKCKLDTKCKADMKKNIAKEANDLLCRFGACMNSWCVSISFCEVSHLNWVEWWRNNKT